MVVVHEVVVHEAEVLEAEVVLEAEDVVVLAQEVPTNHFVDVTIEAIIIEDVITHIIQRTQALELREV